MAETDLMCAFDETLCTVGYALGCGGRSAHGQLQLLQKVREEDGEESKKAKSP